MEKYSHNYEGYITLFEVSSYPVYITHLYSDQDSTFWRAADEFENKDLDWW